MDPDPLDPATPSLVAEHDDDDESAAAEHRARTEFRERQLARHRRYLEFGAVAVVALLIGMGFDAGLVPLASRRNEEPARISQVVATPPPGSLSQAPDGQIRVLNPRAVFTLSVSATPHG